MTTVPPSILPPSVASRRGLNATEKVAVTLLVAGFFFAMELLTGASAAFAALVALYMVLTTATIAVVGGVASFPGVLVIVFVLQHVVAAQLLKFAFWEKPDARLALPITTMAVENLFMLGLLAGGWIGRSIRLARRGPIFPPVDDITKLRAIALVGVGLTLVRQAIVLLSGSAREGAPGTAIGPIKQLAMIDTVAFGAAVAVAVIASRGRRFTNPFVWIVVMPQLLAGFIIGERFATIMPIVAMFVAAWSFGFQFRWKHAALAAALAYFFFFILSPFALAMRAKAGGLDFVSNVTVGMDTFIDVIIEPGKYHTVDASIQKTFLPGAMDNRYFDRDPGPTSNMLERFSMMKTDDILIENTLRDGYTGWATIAPSIVNIMPSSLGFEKTTLQGPGNMMAHRVTNMVHQTDYATGISVGMVCDAFSAFGWVGAFFLPMAVMAVILISYGLLISTSLKRNIFAIALTISLMVSFGEGGIGTLLSAAIYQAALAFLAFFLVTQSAKFVDFRYLRPREVPPFGEGDPTAN